MMSSGRHERGCKRPRHEEPLGIGRVPHRHMPGRVEYALVGKNAARGRADPAASMRLLPRHYGYVNGARRASPPTDLIARSTSASPNRCVMMRSSGNRREASTCSANSTARYEWPRALFSVIFLVSRPIGKSANVAFPHPDHHRATAPLRCLDPEQHRCSASTRRAIDDDVDAAAAGHLERPFERIFALHVDDRVGAKRFRNLESPCVPGRPRDDDAVGTRLLAAIRQHSPAGPDPE